MSQLTCVTDKYVVLEIKSPDLREDTFLGKNLWGVNGNHDKKNCCKTTLGTQTETEIRTHLLDKPTQSAMTDKRGKWLGKNSSDYGEDMDD